VDLDPQSASEWWTTRDEEKNPAAATTWICDHLAYLQNPGFQKKTLPVIAKHRPLKAIQLIHQIDSPQERSYLISRLIGPPLFEGAERYRRQIPSAILDPDLVESDLETFALSGEDLKRVQNAIEQRRKHEAGLLDSHGSK
jgi:hypothetical protein